MTTTTQGAPYLRDQRNFPNDNIQALTVEINKAYIDIAQKVNTRTVGLFAVNNAFVTGEQWYLTATPQQSIREVYSFTGAGNIPHGLNFSSISQFTRCFGSFTDGTNFYGAIYGSSVAITGQVSFYVTPTNIVVLSGAGAPAIVSGILVVEWLSNI